MTWGPSSISLVDCDAAEHQGARTHKIEHGAMVSAAHALQSTGWHYNARTQKHVCPMCVRVLDSRN